LPNDRRDAAGIPWLPSIADVAPGGLTWHISIANMLTTATFIVGLWSARERDGIVGVVVAYKCISPSSQAL
jgi:hypothetical protein